VGGQLHALADLPAGEELLVPTEPMAGGSRASESLLLLPEVEPQLFLQLYSSSKLTDVSSVPAIIEVTSVCIFLTACFS
jgi:hypothetical protein